METLTRLETLLEELKSEVQALRQERLGGPGRLGGDGGQCRNHCFVMEQGGYGGFPPVPCPMHPGRVHVNYGAGAMASARAEAVVQAALAKAETNGATINFVRIVD